MKVKVLLGTVMVLSALVAVRAEDKGSGIEGKWATDAVRTLKKDAGLTGRIVIDTKGDIVVRQIPSGDAPGRNSGRPGGGPIEPLPEKIPDQPDNPARLALIMELSIEKPKIETAMVEGIKVRRAKAEPPKVNGRITDAVSGARFNVQGGLVDGSKFEFRTYRKVRNVKIETVYRGELVDPMTVKLGRFTVTGKPIDVRPDGTPEALVFVRGK